MKLFKLFVLIWSSFFVIPTIYAVEIKEKAAICFNCHGDNGNSSKPMIPNLAGQRTSYLEYQLLAFQSGDRQNPMMQAITSKLSKQNITDLATYFNQQKSQPAPSTEIELIKQGEAKTAMCLGCHGSKAQGRGRFPQLAGQHAHYLQAQLLHFKNKSRQGGVMNAMTRALSPQDIKEISAYLSQL